MLFLIEPEKYKAALDIAKATLLTSQANYENARKDHDRNRVLIGKKAISQKDYDTSLANFNTARANLESAKATLANATLDYNFTSVSAPFDGVVGDALVNVGEYVSTNGKDLVRVTNLNPIYANFYIADVERLSIERNLTSGSVKAKAIFDNNSSKLVPGTFTTIYTDSFVQKNGFQIPQVAILQDVRNTYVYTLDAENKVKKTIVKIVYQANDYAVISEGLKDGDKVILNNFKKIRPGAVVQEMPAQAMQAPQG